MVIDNLSIPFGMLQPSAQQERVTGWFLSIPFGMLPFVDCYVQFPTPPFNSFWDATQVGEDEKLKEAIDFQFLLGCYKRFSGD